MRVLIVDDDHSVRRALQLLLETLGHEVVGIAVDGDEAGDTYDKLQPELVFLDVRLPRVHGLDSLQRLIGKHPDACVIMYTGGDSCEKEATALGALGYLEKPFSLASIEKEIGKVIVRRSRPVAAATDSNPTA
jgi:two-component system chemotaxis response regulator CheY